MRHPDAVDPTLYEKHKTVHNRRIDGPFRRFKWTVMVVTLAIYYGTPWIRWDRGPYAPDLADAIWLYGGGRAQVARQVSAPRHGVMPAWGGRLDPVTIKMLAAYVHSLGGGEDFVEVAADPAVEVDEQP